MIQIKVIRPTYDHKPGSYSIDNPPLRRTLDENVNAFLGAIPEDSFINLIWDVKTAHDAICIIIYKL